MALNTLGESNGITLRLIYAHCGYEGSGLADQLDLQREVLTMIELLGSNYLCYAASVTQH